MFLDEKLMKNEEKSQFSFAVFTVFLVYQILVQIELNPIKFDGY